jgi:L-alanine-DL-glutamate epimerase-like enolase superfamily enzyme
LIPLGVPDPEEAEMTDRIQSLKALTVSIPFKKDFVTSKERYSVLPYVIVEARSESGHVGYGETREATEITGETHESIVSLINGRFGPALKGMDPFDIEAVHNTMEAKAHGNPAAKCGVDVALYDLMGRISGLPVYQFLGGRTRPEVVTSKAVGLGPLPEMVSEARSLVDQGFSLLKLKTGIDPDAEIAMVKAVREAVGPKVGLKLDANQGWNLKQALKILRAVEDCSIEVVEQPLPEWDLKGSAELRKLVVPPIMLDEGVKSPQDVIRIVEERAADMINIKLLKCGGLYPASAINSIAEAAGMICQVGSLDTTVGSAAVAHLATAKKNIRYAEIVGPTRIARDVASGLTIRGEKVIVGEGPGLGISVNRDLLEREI